MQAPARDVELRLSGFRYWYRAYPCAGSPIEPIVFVSGGWQAMEAWETYTARLSRFAPVVLVELPGNGRADVLPARFGLDFLVDALAHVVSAERLSRINLFAFSYGTPIAVRYCQLHARSVGSALLVGAALGLGPAQRATFAEGAAHLREGALADFVDCGLRGLMCQEERTPIFRRQEVAKRVAALWSRDFESLRGRYEQNALRLLLGSRLAIEPPADVPALVFTGEHDLHTTPDEGREVARAFTRSAFTQLQRADHFCLLEQPRVAMRLIQRFFQGRSLDDVPGCAPIERFNRRLPAPAALPSRPNIQVHAGAA